MPSLTDTRLCKYLILGAIISFFILVYILYTNDNVKLTYAPEYNQVTQKQIQIVNASQILRSDENDDEDNTHKPNSFNLFFDSISHFVEQKQTREYFILLNRMDNNVYFPQHSILTYSMDYGNVLYHCNYMNAGLGNNLLSYWFSRGLAFFFNLRYKSFFTTEDINIFNTSQYIKQKLLSLIPKRACMISDGRWKEDDTKKLRLEGFVPNTSNITFNSLISHVITQQGNDDLTIENTLNKYSMIQQYLLQLMIRAVVKDPSGHQKEKNQSKYDGDFLLEFDTMRTWGASLTGNIAHPWGNMQWSTFYLNDIIKEIMHIDTENAFKIMATQGLLAEDDMKEFPVIRDGKYSQNINDISIHIRCGDIIRVGVRYNGFQTMKYFKNARDIIIDRTGVNDTSKANVYIIMNILDDKSIWEKKNSFLDNKFEDHQNCRIFSEYIMDYFKNEVFKEYNEVYLISNGTMYSDYYKMMYSSNIICGFSTYCLCAVLCNNQYNTVILPDSWYNKIDFIPTGFILIRNFWISSREMRARNLTANELGEFVITH